MVLALLIALSTALPVSSVLASDCLPSWDSFTKEDRFTSCTVDADCALYREACRSCLRPPKSVSRKTLDEVVRKDLDLRRQSGCVITCEACSLVAWRAVCRQKRCEAAAVHSVPGAQ